MNIKRIYENLDREYRDSLSQFILYEVNVLTERMIKAK